MCTVTYLPLGDTSYLLGHSRDETRERQSTRIVKSEMGGQAIIYPEDPRGKGSWLAVRQGCTLAVMNGSRRNHQRTPPYRKSRWKVLLEAIQYPTLVAFADDYDLTQIEPFTLIARTEDHLCELHWDGELIDILSLPLDEPHVWASWTLYDREQQKIRQEALIEWQKVGLPNSANSVFHFHKQHDLVLPPAHPLDTISISTVRVNAETIDLHWQSLPEGREMRGSLP